MPIRITFRASVSFESDARPVQTQKTTLIAANAAQAARRALTGARQEFAGSRPRSIVIVLEELSRERQASRAETQD